MNAEWLNFERLNIKRLNVEISNVKQLNDETTPKIEGYSTSNTTQRRKNEHGNYWMSKATQGKKNTERWIQT
jgi:hypothetical protein